MMAWIEPITNWGDGDIYTYDDWNRVIIDADILLPDENIDTYMMSENGFLTFEAWEYVVSALYDRAQELNLFVTRPAAALIADNFNALELLLVVIKEREDQIARQIGARIYAGDDLYASSMGQYTDVTENYVR